MDKELYKLPVRIMQMQGRGTHASWFLNGDVAARLVGGVQNGTYNVKLAAVQKRSVYGSFAREELSG